MLSYSNMLGQYAPLCHYLLRVGTDTVTLPFSGIETIIGSELPPGCVVH